MQNTREQGQTSGSKRVNRVHKLRDGLISDYKILASKQAVMTKEVTK